MSGTTPDCTGCASTQRRFRCSKPKLWCTRYHRLATVRCIDYRSKPSAIRAVLNFLRASCK